MLWLFLSVILISGITGQSTGEKCDYPPPKVANGEGELMNYYLVKGGPVIYYSNVKINASVTKVYKYEYTVTCNPGFTMVGDSFVTCDDGNISEIPSCVSDCQVSPEDQSLVSCGMGFDNRESKCTIPSGGIAGFERSSGPAAKCGRLPIGSFVAGGNAAKHGDVPWHVGIYTKTTRPFMQICGGTLVRNNVVISAAHCFWNDIKKKLPAENFAVAAGKIYRPWNAANDTSSAAKSNVREIRIPPRFRGSATNFQDDLAVLLLSTPLEFTGTSVGLACIDFDNTLDKIQLQDGKIGKVAGWGLTSADGAASQILNVVQLPVVDIERCINRAEPSFLTSITSDKICAGYNNGTAVCRGDSGGGLAIPQQDYEGDQYFLRGVVSTAPKSDHLCNVYAVTTFTHVAKHRHFINAVMSETAKKSPGPALPSIGDVDQPPDSVARTNPPSNADVNTGVNTNVGENTEINNGENTDINNSESNLSPITEDDGNDLGTAPTTESSDDDPKDYTVATPKTEEDNYVFCKSLKNTNIKRCAKTLNDLSADGNFIEKKCKNIKGLVFHDCEIIKD